MKTLTFLLTLGLSLFPRGAMAQEPLPKKVQKIAATYASSGNSVKVVVAMDGETPKKLDSCGGALTTRSRILVVTTIADFPGASADQSVSSTKPTLYVISSSSPKGRLFLVKVESGKSNRTLKIGKTSPFSGVNVGAPDADSLIEYASEEVQPGAWRLIPKQELGPGEYGLYLPSALSLGSTVAGELFGFSVAKK